MFPFTTLIPGLMILNGVSISLIFPLTSIPFYVLKDLVLCFNVDIGQGKMEHKSIIDMTK